MEELLTLDEVAKLLKVHVKTVRREIDAGRLASVKVRRSIRVTASEFAKYVRHLSQK
jgi:excisionase family DNA binding protein